jgi:hypothetical protein
MSDSPAVDRSVRLRRAAVFLAGAVLAGVLLLGPLSFDWVPLVVGLVYLAAAGLGGPRGGLWATALPVTGWGLGVVAAREGWIDTQEGALFLLGAGLGVLGCGLLAARGYAIGMVEVGAVVIAAGLLAALAPHVGLLVEPGLYVALLAVVGGTNLALARR